MAQLEDSYLFHVASAGGSSTKDTKICFPDGALDVCEVTAGFIWEFSLLEGSCICHVAQASSKYGWEPKLGTNWFPKDRQTDKNCNNIYITCCAFHLLEKNY